MADDKRSGGVNAQAGNDMNINGDVSGRDKILTTQTTVVNAPESSRPTSYAIAGLVIVAVLAILVLAYALPRPASPTLTGSPTTSSTSTLLPAPTQMAERATLPNSATSSAAGHGLVTVTAISPVVASTSAEPNTSTLPPDPTLAPNPSVTPAAAPTQPVAPSTKLPTAIKPANRPSLGTLDVRVTLEDCNGFTYDVLSNINQGTGTGHANTKQQVATGAYTITLKSPTGEQFTNHAVIQPGQTTTVDFTPILGKLRINGYSEIGGPSYEVSPGGISLTQFRINWFTIASDDMDTATPHS
jgi:hypothetical protein